MLSRQNRITENRDFLKIFKTVRPVHTEHLTFRVARRIVKASPRDVIARNEAIYSKEIATPPTKGMARNDNDAKKLQPTTYNLQPRFGFVVSNKIDKRSARRNGLKRRIRAVIESQLLHFPSGVEVVIQTKKPFNFPYDFRSIEKEVMEGLRKAGLLR